MSCCRIRRLSYWDVLSLTEVCGCFSKTKVTLINARSYPEECRFPWNVCEIWPTLLRNVGSSTIHLKSNGIDQVSIIDNFGIIKTLKYHHKTFKNQENAKRILIVTRFLVGDNLDPEKHGFLSTRLKKPYKTFAFLSEGQTSISRGPDFDWARARLGSSGKRESDLNWTIIHRRPGCCCEEPKPVC